MITKELKYYFNLLLNVPGHVLDCIAEHVIPSTSRALVFLVTSCYFFFSSNFISNGKPSPYLCYILNGLIKMPTDCSVDLIFI